MTRYVVAWLVANAVTMIMILTMICIKMHRRLKNRYGQYHHYYMDDYYAKYVTYMCTNDPWMAGWFSGSRVIHWIKVLTIGWLAAGWMLNCYYDFEEAEDHFELYEGD